VVDAGVHHGTIFKQLIEISGVFGPAMTDAYWAAIALAYGYALCKHDEGIRRFTSLKLENPLTSVRR